MLDCVIVGYNDYDFPSYVRMTRAMGVDSGAYRDLDLAFVHYQDRPMRSMDVLSHFYHQGREEPRRPFSNVDFTWPVVLYLGTYLHRRGFSFDFVNLFQLEKQKLQDLLATEDVLTVAITTTLYVTAHAILEIVAFVKQHNETARIVIGGPYVDNQAKVMTGEELERLFKYLGADFYVINNEGEETLAKLLAALKHGGDLGKIHNLAYRDGGRFVRTERVAEANSLAENLVDYSLFAPRDLGAAISIRTAKSCPFACSFCGFPQRAGQYTYMGVDLVEQELNALNDLGVTMVSFLDDTFNVPKPRFQEILRMMIRNRYDFRWNSFYRSDHGNEETIDLMGRAGCEGVFIGMESGSDVMLKAMNKSSRRHHYAAAIPRLRDAGVSTYASLIFGFPGETRATVRETMDFIEEHRPDFYRAQLWYADPVTPIWNRREEVGLRGMAFNWSHATMDCLTACELIEEAMLSIEGSVWMPQYGFEQWSTFYLQRKGMSMGQIKAFVNCFNAIVKDKLIHRHRQEIEPRLLESLRRAAQFDRQHEPDAAAIEIYAGARYKAAEACWVNELGSAPPAPVLGLLRDGGLDEDGPATRPCALGQDALGRLRRDLGEDLPYGLLVAFGLLFSQLSGSHEMTVVSAWDGADGAAAVPLRLTVADSTSFREAAARVRARLRELAPHQRFALALLTNPWRMAEHAGSCPAFELGFRYGHRRDDAGLGQALRHHPDLHRGLGVTLEVIDDGAAAVGQLTYNRAWFAPATIDRIGACLGAVLEDLARAPDRPLGGVLVEARAPASAATAADSSEAFNF